MESKSKDIKLCNLLKTKLIELNPKGKNKMKLICELVNIASRSGKLKNKKAFLRAVLERERLGSTGIGNGVAIPHAKSKVIKDFILVFAKSKEGINFGALDGEEVHLFFMLASPQDSIGEHLKILAKIAHLMKDKFTIELLRRAKSKKEILGIISAFERRWGE